MTAFRPGRYNCIEGFCENDLIKNLICIMNEKFYFAKSLLRVLTLQRAPCKTLKHKI